MNSKNDATNPISLRIHMIEDDARIRKNLSRFFYIVEDIELSMTADSVEEYLQQRVQPSYKSPDVLLLDIGLPGMTGLEAIPKLLADDPELDIIMLTTYEDESKVLEAMSHGAVGYISKKTSLKDIAAAIRVVHAGGSYMSPMIAREVFNYMSKSKETPIEDALTERQLEVLKAIVKGGSYTQIAKELFLSPETVKSHTKNIYKAMKVNSKVEAISQYLKYKRTIWIHVDLIQQCLAAVYFLSDVFYNVEFIDRKKKKRTAEKSISRPFDRLYPINE